MDIEVRELIEYLKSLGIEVNTCTKARGHQGFYIKNRIDVSKNIPQAKVMPTLLHEFAHYIHSGLESDIGRSGGRFEVLFKSDEVDVYHKELVRVTNFVDSHSKCEKLKNYKSSIKKGILEQEEIIKIGYPNFMRSKKFKEFEKYIKNSKAKYLLKCDRIYLKSGMVNPKTEFFSIDNLEKDFPDMPEEFAAYIRLRSYLKKQSRVTARINKLNKYYERPAELFARLVEGLYIDSQTVQGLAPYTCYRFYKLLHEGYYGELLNVFESFL